MAISMYRASASVYKRMLGNLGLILERAAAYAEKRQIEPSALLHARLAPDMFHLIRQVQIATDEAKGTVARLAGQEPPEFERDESSFAGLKARIARTIAFIQRFKPEQLNGSEEREIVLTVGGETIKLNGLCYLLDFGTPNVYFHITTAYAILRHSGLDIGKRDFFGIR